MTRPPHLCPHCATAAARRWQPRCCPQPSGSGSFLAPPSPPDPGGCGAAALTDVGVAESVLRMDGDASASLHHQVPQAPAAQEHDEEAQPRRHVAPEVPPHFCGAGGGRCCVRLTLFLLSSSPCAAAACRAAVSVAASLGGTARSWREVRRGALRTERDRRAELYPARAARALEAPPRAANGSAALPHRRERGAGLSPPRLIGNRAGARWAGARSRFWLRPRPRSWFWLRPAPPRSDPIRSRYCGVGEASLRTGCTSLLPARHSLPRAAPRRFSGHLENGRGACGSLGKLALFPFDPSGLSANWV